jgi:NAD(P)-dependent dehydrogenase (short-subunit alcohol dehydrogenase family)
VAIRAGRSTGSRECYDRSPFARNLVASNNTVIGLVRDKVATDNKISEQLSGRANITILEADITDLDALKQAVAATEDVTGGGVDCLIANAAPYSNYDFFDPIGVLSQDPVVFEERLNASLRGNMTCQIFLINVFLPLILKSNMKKVIYISSAQADPSLPRDFDIDNFPIYAISKAGMNMAMAKFSAQYKEQGVLFLSLCPGMVDVGRYHQLTPHQQARRGVMVKKLLAYSPEFRGPSKPEEAIKACLEVIHQASIENGDGGAFVSHKGKGEKWL